MMDWDKFEKMVCKNAAQGWKLAVSMQKALRMFTEGYRMEPMYTEGDGLYLVTNPAGVQYRVSTKFFASCTCPDFQSTGLACKHICFCHIEQNRMDDWADE